MEAAPRPESAHPIRERILRSAAEVIAALPLSKVTMEDFARAAGVARQTIYKHFGRRDELIAALFVREIESTHAPVLERLSAEAPSPARLTQMFVAEMELALQWSLLSRTFDPASAPRIAELVMGSPEILECNERIWIPILEAYRSAGVVRDDVDLKEAIRWLTYQHVWFLSHPDALTADADERRHFIERFVLGGLVSPGS